MTSATMMMIDVNLPIHRSHLAVRLSRPSDDAECPILQEPIANAVLEPFPRPYLSDQPAHTAMTLQCGHTFHAMALVYHWARNRNVLCPVCRAGPQHQRLVVGKLPKEWRYSMAARVRREQRKDRDEEEQRNHQVALAMQEAGTTATLELFIRIEAEPGVSPPAWNVRTVFAPINNALTFVVPAEELKRIPYSAEQTMLRLVPYTDMHVMRPSSWFRAGTTSGQFSVGADHGGFHHIHFSVSEELFAILVADTLMLHQSRGGFRLVLFRSDEPPHSSG
jgi:hypothetical protein